MTVSASIQLNDLMSGPIMHIMSAIDTMCNHLELVDSAIDKGFDTSGIFEVRQQIDLANAELTEMQNKIESVDNTTKKVANSTDDWLGKISKIGAGYFSLKTAIEGVKFAVGLSDEVTQTQARLNLLINNFNESTTVDELFSRVSASAQDARGSLTDMAAVVARIGNNAKDAFSGSDEVVAFANLVQKQMTIAGATTSEASNAMLQLSQALGSGVLRGDELNSIFENAPNLIQNIADYLDVPIGQIRDMAADGELSATTVKSAIFSAADDINEKFNSMPMTWGQMWTKFQNTATMAFKPVLNKINEIANSPTMQILFENIGNALVPIANALTWIVDKVSAVGGAVVENWSIISPIIMGVAIALGIYTIALIAHNVIQGISNAIKTVHAAALALETGATFAATAAQYGFNTALLACPITWIIIAIIALIAIIFAVCAAIAKSTGVANSAFGVICGYVAVAGAFIYNIVVGLLNGIIQIIWTIFVTPFLGIIEWILNVCNGGFNSFGDAVANLIGQIISWFLDLGKVVTKIIDAIFGQDWTSGLNALQDNVLAWGKNENAITISRDAPEILQRVEYSNAWNVGSAWGDDVSKKISDSFNPDNKDYDKSDDKFKFDPSEFKNLTSGTDKTAKNTKDIAKNTEKATSLLELVKDNWEKEAIMKYTSSAKTITYDLSGMTNTYINTGEAFDAVKELGRYLNRKMSTSAEGV